jgi:hypothetical protein
MKEVSADKGYLGASNMLATLQRGAIPYIPFKTNQCRTQASYGPKSELWTRCGTSMRCIVRSFYSTITSVKRRDNVPHDQIEVWSTLAESDAHGAD